MFLAYKKRDTFFGNDRKNNSFFQAKLSVNQPNDPESFQDKQEANNVAGQVMHMDSPLQKPHFFLPLNIQRKCKNCEEEDKLAQRKENNNSSSTASTETENYITSIPGGKPLAAAERSFFESRMGYDFSNVRIHNHNDAHQSAKNINALAYTNGNNIVFNTNQYQPGTNEGKKLLAHELTHVVQQNTSSTPSVQRDTVTGTKTSNKGYDINDSEKQVRSTRSVGFAEVKMSYDESASSFTVTFPLTWIFPHGWDDKKRSEYANEFEKEVLRVWQNRFVLKETGGKKRSAHVQINFDRNIIPHMNDAYDESIALSKILKEQSTWLMDVRKTSVRANVKGSTVELDENANKPQERKGSDLRDGSQFSVNDGNDNKKFKQTTSPHEFGHMLGLGDEYLNDDGTKLSDINVARGHINDRIMNVGENVTADVYTPFADWLSDLTKSTWTVGAKVSS
jgi:hypothetical protein